MDALLLALLLTLALDQGAGTQALAAQIGHGDNRGGPVAGLVLMVAVNAIIAAAMGSAIAALLIAEARLLFFAIALLLGAFGLFTASLRPRHRPASLPETRPGRALMTFALRRAGENGAFAVAGVAALTGTPILAAIGAMLGGWASLVPPLALGGRYVGSHILRGVQPVAGLVLLCAGIWCAAGALRLI